MAHLIIHERDFIRRARRRLSLDERLTAARETLFDHVAAIPSRYFTHVLILAVAAIVALGLARS